MLRSLWSRLIDTLAGDSGRAAQLGRDDRRTIPGWPCGLNLGAARAVAASVSDRDQKALPLYWEASSSPTMRPGHHVPFAVIEGGRGAGASVRVQVRT